MKTSQGKPLACCGKVSRLGISWFQIALLAGGVAVLETAAQAYTPPAIGLVSWWQGEGNALDSVSANNGSLVGGVTYAPGKKGSAFSFDGTGYVLVPHNASLSFSSALTIGLWYKPADGFTASYGLIDKRIGAAGANYGINNSSFAGMGVYFDDPTVLDGDDTGYGSVFEASRYNPSPAPGVFHHLAATYHQISATQVQLDTYLDGLLVRTKVINGNLANTINNSPVTIGATSQGGGEFFNGLIDEVTIYNRALSGSEVFTLATVPEPTVGTLLAGTFLARLWKYGRRNSRRE
jgi:hypothetical protein